MTGTATSETARWVLRIHRARVEAEAATDDLGAAVAEALRAGCSWTTIGRGLGVTRQAAWSTWHEWVKGR